MTPKFKNEKQEIHIDMPDFAKLKTVADDPYLPDPDLYDLYTSRARREIWIHGEIDDDSVAYCKEIARFNQEDVGLPYSKRKPIIIFINTCGGDVTMMMSLVQMIQHSKTPIITVNFTQALSAGAYILAAGHRRYAFVGSIALIHSGSVGINGDREKVESAQKFFNALTKKATDFLLSVTNIEPKTMKKLAPNDWYLTEEEALKVGLVDGIIGTIDDIDTTFTERKEEADGETATTKE